MLEFRNVNLSNQSRIPVHKSSKVGPCTEIIAFLKRKPLHWILKKSQLSALSSGYWSDQVGQNGKSKKSWRLSCKPWRILKVWILKVIMVGGYVYIYRLYTANQHISSLSLSSDSISWKSCISPWKRGTGRVARECLTKLRITEGYWNIQWIFSFLNNMIDQRCKPAEIWQKDHQYLKQFSV